MRVSHDRPSNSQSNAEKRLGPLNHSRSESITVNHQLDVESEPNTLPSVSGSNSTEPLIRKNSHDARQEPSKPDLQGVSERMVNVGRRLSLLTASRKAGKYTTNSRVAATLTEE